MSSGGNDVFVARFDPTSKLVEALAFGDSADQAGLGCGADGPGNVWIMGTNAGALDFGFGPKQGAFLARFTP